MAGAGGLARGLATSCGVWPAWPTTLACVAPEVACGSSGAAPTARPEARAWLPAVACSARGTSGGGALSWARWPRPGSARPSPAGAVPGGWQGAWLAHGRRGSFEGSWPSRRGRLTLSHGARRPAGQLAAWRVAVAAGSAGPGARAAGARGSHGRARPGGVARSRSGGRGGVPRTYSRRYQMKNCRWRPTFALETGGPSNTDGQDFDEDSGFLGRTRLGRLIQAAARELLDKLNSARTNSPTKIFLVLLGFYTANALATILGQTGDWDVLVAGVVVAAIEGIGMLMYRKPITRPPGRFQSLISMVNYWKAGVCLGLFVDAFKLGS
ncbi:hypothetical protein BDA96_02G162800 [Sorghum bicolor]|uniref:Ycf20-like protein n=1 Tax=Sorghum bicolor TaxID=4558 RepID=A0A921RMR2_SORBI|nr:hypothetical protein BDA96_02G162800 [Sorghum bicolor]